MKHLAISILCAHLAAAAAAQIPECDDMHTTDSGLSWGVLAAGGDEPGPGPDDLVEVHYTGWLADGTRFDSSRGRGEPFRCQAGRGVIRGWTEALQMMTPGARFKLVVPPELGYGAEPAPGIPPQSTLVFDLELLRVVPLPACPPADPDRQRELQAGVRYEMLAVGSGPKASKDQAVSFRFAIFAADGRLVDCTEQRGGRTISGRRQDLPAGFLQELCELLKLGDRVRVAVPQAAVPGSQGDTVWVLELTGVHEVPAFRALDPQSTVTTASGLRYELLAPGEGPSPGAGDTVLALYTGWLPDGTMFDSAHARGAPTSFALASVIPGFAEGLRLMRAGGRCLFEIPPELGYGVRGAAGIPPNATLVFLVELVAVR